MHLGSIGCGNQYREVALLQVAVSSVVHYILIACA